MATKTRVETDDPNIKKDMESVCGTSLYSLKIALSKDDTEEFSQLKRIDLPMTMINKKPMINKNCNDEKVEFDAFDACSLSSIRSQQSCDVDSDGKNLSLQNKKKLKHSTVHMKCCPGDVGSFV
jgi:hypothetical protein